MKKTATTKTVTKYLVEETEHDSWSGPKVIDTIEFTSKAKAEAYVNKVNGKNTAKQVPEYYVTADIVKVYQARVGK